MSITFKAVYEHYNVYIDGKFYCSCDNMDEVEEEIKEINKIVDK